MSCCGKNSVISEYLHLIFRPDSRVRFLNTFLFAPGLSRGIRLADLPEIKFRCVKRYASVFLLFVLCICPLPVANAATVTLAWNSNAEPDLEGYVVYWNEGYSGPPYEYSEKLPEDDLDDPLHPRLKLTGLKKDSTYHIALTAYDTDGNESDFSREACVQVVNDVIGLCSQSASPGTGSTSSSSGSGGGGGGGGSCFISGTFERQSFFLAQNVTKPFIRSRVQAIIFLVLILIAAARPGLNKANRKKDQ